VSGAVANNARTVKNICRYTNELTQHLKIKFSLLCTRPDSAEQRNDRFGRYQHYNEGHTRKATAKFVDNFLVELGLVTEAPHKHEDAYYPLQDELPGHQ
jgi:hypothetical protein